MKFSYSILLSTILISSCKEEIIIDEGGITSPPSEISQPVLPDMLMDYENDTFPDYIYSTQALAFFGSFGNNLKITNEAATLGRVLFYDTQLSLNNNLACGSCHNQENAFSGANFKVEGVGGIELTRNAPALFNKNFERRMFWDLRASDVLDQVLKPIQDPHELNMDLDDLRSKLSSSNYYPELFSSAFGNDSMTNDNIATALTSFILSIKSYQSKYDEGLQNDFSNFTEQELRGQDLFFGAPTNCNQCHMTNNFYQPNADNNGLEVDYDDLGLQYVTGNVVDNGNFKTPSLRNINLTAPYMHDGRFSTLYEVISFYNEDIQAHPNLGDQLTSGALDGSEPIQMGLSEQDKLDLISFLKTLTDDVFVQDEKFSNPFE